MKKSKEGDAEARQELICGNLRLVLSIIQRFTNRGENLDDLFQVGCIGLVKAVDSFNADNGARFATYASKCIQNEILMNFRSQKKRAAQARLSTIISLA